MPSNRAVSSVKQILSLADDGTVTSTLASIQDLIDSAYVAARSSAGGTDSAAVIALIDSAYVAARSSGGGTDVGDVYTYSLIFGE